MTHNLIYWIVEGEGRILSVNAEWTRLSASGNHQVQLKSLTPNIPHTLGVTGDLLGPLVGYVISDQITWKNIGEVIHDQAQNTVIPGNSLCLGMFQTLLSVY